MTKEHITDSPLARRRLTLGADKTETQQIPIQPDEQLDERPSAKTTKANVIGRPPKEEKTEQQTIRIPLSLRKWLRMQAAIEERDIAEIATEALEDYKRKVTNK